MNILIAGASGFIGTLLVKQLSPMHQISVLGRNLAKLEHIFPKNIHKITWDSLKEHDAAPYDLLINLSGSSIGAKRWREKIKHELIESRTLTNKRLTEWLIAYHAKPRFFCANAIGIYGAQVLSTGAFDEDTPIPQQAQDFLQHIGLAWEQSLKPALDAGIFVTTLRFGVVLKKREGMLKKLELPFGLGLGSIIGSGNQTLSWVHYEDLINAVNFLINQPSLPSTINITSPSPVTQKEFATSLAAALNRPLFIKMPGWFVKILFGEMGNYLLLQGQKVLPKRLTELGFQFTYPNIVNALNHEYQ
ncbi:TIGR01777 family oxidoreductase [Legionella sp. km772]|uniref:TIGR01777 family oxidoreductase n=1 Tax=Legionella sp. km772 TaxID=2498111 RepID=UPI000F8CD3C6|nr:TIGR01777 family oxidoreductase [Legionella sp. km772]RUR07427.1 TIGR01777 family protein [Legionella sp. km772]